MMKTLVALAIALAATAVALEDPSPVPKPPPHIQTDEEMKAAIVKGIVANPEVFAARLRVEAVSGFVTLRGSVKNADGRATAERIARAVPGVRKVNNRLIIRRPAP